MTELAKARTIEIEYWRDAEHERPDVDSIHNIVNKMAEAAVLLDCLARCAPALSTTGRVLELGGGQGWSACVYKRLHPGAHVTTSDLSPFAVASRHRWERLFDVRLDGAYDCPSDAIPEADGALDCVVAYAAAHHFRAHRRTFRELHRVLRPGGWALYLYEPSPPAALHRMAAWRVNRKRPEVPEDVLRTRELLDLARREGLEADVVHYPSTLRRGPAETLYYCLLGAVPFLQRALPCTANYIFTRPPDDAEPTP